jgi:uncharacterized protein (TIGR00369 family)
LNSVATREEIVTQKEKTVKESFSRQAFMRTIGAEIVSLEHGKIEVRLAFKPGLTQQNGFIHAGVITSIMDSACGYAAMGVNPDYCDVVSVEFKVNLVAPAKRESFVARATVKRTGKTLIVCSADAFAIHGGQEELVATMLATMMNIPDSSTA